MIKITAAHYSDTVFYNIDKIVKEIKSDLNQYIFHITGITAEQFAVLDTIYSNENICQHEVAKINSKDKSNIQRIIIILETKGYITRTVGRKNNRLVNYLTITQDGRELIDNNIFTIRRYMEKIFNSINPDEVEFLKKIITKVNDNLKGDNIIKEEAN